MWFMRPVISRHRQHLHAGGKSEHGGCPDLVPSSPADRDWASNPPSPHAAFNPGTNTTTYTINKSFASDSHPQGSNIDIAPGPTNMVFHQNTLNHTTGAYAAEDGSSNGFTSFTRCDPGSRPRQPSTVQQHPLWVNLWSSHESICL